MRETFQKGEFRQIFKARERGRVINIQKDTQWKKQVVCKAHNILGKANIYWTREES